MGTGEPDEATETPCILRLISAPGRTTVQCQCYDVATNSRTSKCLNHSVAIPNPGRFNIGSTYLP